MRHTPQNMFMPPEGEEMTGCDPVRPELRIDSRAFRDDNEKHFFNKLLEVERRFSGPIWIESGWRNLMKKENRLADPSLNESTSDMQTRGV